MNSKIKYPLCSQIMGLEINRLDIIQAHDLEAILQQAIVVYEERGFATDIWEANVRPNNMKSKTHTALLIGIKQIKEKTTLEKINDLLDNGLSSAQYKLSEIKKLIEAQNDG